jgi:hypothetical protein
MTLAPAGGSVQAASPPRPSSGISRKTPIRLGVPLVRHTAEIEVRAPAAAAFAVVERDMLAVRDEPDAMSGHRPAAEGPLRTGFRWRQWLVHERQHCVTEWVVRKVDAPLFLEQDSWHYCAAAQWASEGGERWEFVEGSDGRTRVKLSAWSVHGLGGWVVRLLDPGTARQAKLSLRKRLAYVQFAAERQPGT